MKNDFLVAITQMSAERHLTKETVLETIEEALVLAYKRQYGAAKAVIGTAGFTLISEALYLRKPYLALPMQGQFEQQLNAYQLNKLGYGVRVDEIRPEAIGHFLYRLPDFQQRLSQYEPGDNRAIQAKLDELLADDGALARRYHEARQ